MTPLGAVSRAPQHPYCVRGDLYTNLQPCNNIRRTARKRQTPTSVRYNCLPPQDRRKVERETTIPHRTARSLPAALPVRRSAALDACDQGTLVSAAPSCASRTPWRLRRTRSSRSAARTTSTLRMATELHFSLQHSHHYSITPQLVYCAALG